MKKNKTLVLEVGGAGGSISLWSINAEDGQPFFIVVTDEKTLKELMDERDAENINFKSKTAPLDTFDHALVAFGKYPWHLLHPLFVHKDFIEPILNAVTKLGGEEVVRRWQSRIAFMNEFDPRND